MSESEDSGSLLSEPGPQKKKPKSLINAQKKRKRDQLRSRQRRSKDDPMTPYRKFAKWYMRSQDMFVNYYDVLTLGIRWENDNFGKYTADEFARKYQYNLLIYGVMVDAVPQFGARDLEDLRYNSEAIESLAKAMTDAANAARGDDIGSLVDKGLLYVALEQQGRLLQPPIPPGVGKDARGHSHPVLSRLLCPVNFLDEFDEDPAATMRKLKKNTIKTLYNDLASMLYPHNAHDPDDIEHQLLRNPIAIRFFRHLFISPQSALRDEPGRSRSKPGQARLNNMSEVTPGSIAYTYTLFRHTIAAVNDWREDEDLFDRTKGYYAIRDLFEKDDDGETWMTWAADTLSFWNRNVFGDDWQTPLDEESDDDSLIRPMSLQALKRQRANKEVLATKPPGDKMPSQSPTNRAATPSISSPAYAITVPPNARQATPFGSPTRPHDSPASSHPVQHLPATNHRHHQIQSASRENVLRPVTNHPEPSRKTGNTATTKPSLGHLRPENFFEDDVDELEEDELEEDEPKNFRRLKKRDENVGLVHSNPGHSQQTVRSFLAGAGGGASSSSRPGLRSSQPVVSSSSSRHTNNPPATSKAVPVKKKRLIS